MRCCVRRAVERVGFVELEPSDQLKWGSCRGDRIGIYSFNNQTNAGYLDVDFFHYQYTNDGNGLRTGR